MIGVSTELRATARTSMGLRRFWGAVTINRKVTAGACIVAFFVLVGVFGPMFIRQDPNTFTTAVSAPPSAAHWLGTTLTGQDIFAQIVVGTRSSIFWGLGTGLAVTTVSIVMGLVSGYFGGAVDEVLMLITNVFLVIPGLPLAIVLASYFPRGELTVALAITVTSWAWGARVLRSQTLTMRSRDFITAARASGEKTWRIIFFEILPNEIALVAAELLGTIIYAILAEAGLEFLGLGDITVVSWGTMFYWAGNNDAILLGAWWWIIPPGLCIAALGAGLAFMNFGIDEIANPRLRKEKTPGRIKTGRDQSAPTKGKVAVS